MTAVTSGVFEFEPIVQQWQQIRVPASPGNPSGVYELPMYQGANTLNDLGLSFDPLDRDEFFKHRHVRRGFTELAKFEAEPLPIRREVARHQKHDPHHASDELSETNDDRDRIAPPRHPLHEVVLAARFARSRFAEEIS